MPQGFRANRPDVLPPPDSWAAIRESDEVTEFTESGRRTLTQSRIPLEFSHHRNLEKHKHFGRCVGGDGREYAGMKKCGRCAKPAVLHITELQHGEVKGLLHLCESCAKEYLSHGHTAPPDAEVAESGVDEGDEPFDELDQHVCPSCGITFKEFRSQGRLGCPNDYIAFQDELLPLLENIHGETQHVGKVPKRAPHASQKQYQLIRLRSQLRAAVDEEMYEEAARLRDQIAVIERELTVGQPAVDA